MYFFLSKYFILFLSGSPLQGGTSQSVMVMEDDGRPHSQSESDSLSHVGWPGRLVPTFMQPTSQLSAFNPQFSVWSEALLWPPSGFRPRNPASKQCTAKHTRPSHVIHSQHRPMSPPFLLSHTHTRCYRMQHIHRMKNTCTSCLGCLGQTRTRTLRAHLSLRWGWGMWRALRDLCNVLPHLPLLSISLQTGSHHTT